MLRVTPSLSLQQIGRLNVECIGYSPKHLNALVPPAALDAAARLKGGSRLRFSD